MEAYDLTEDELALVGRSASERGAEDRGAVRRASVYANPRRLSANEHSGVGVGLGAFLGHVISGVFGHAIDPGSTRELRFDVRQPLGWKRGGPGSGKDGWRLITGVSEG